MPCQTVLTPPLKSLLKAAAGNAAWRPRAMAQLQWCYFTPPTSHLLLGDSLGNILVIAWMVSNDRPMWLWNNSRMLIYSPVLLVRPWRVQDWRCPNLKYRAGPGRSGVWASTIGCEGVGSALISPSEDLHKCTGLWECKSLHTPFRPP